MAIAAAVLTLTAAVRLQPGYPAWDVGPGSGAQAVVCGGMPQTTPREESREEREIRALVEAFGRTLKNVSLLAPDAAASIEANYGPFVSRELLERWKQDPQSAPGRTVSSPWPDRIQIQNIAKTGRGQYVVEGLILEVTSEDLEQGGAAAKRAITLSVRKENCRWVIWDVVLGEYMTKEPKADYAAPQGATFV